MNRRTNGIPHTSTNKCIYTCMTASLHASTNISTACYLEGLFFCGCASIQNAFIFNSSLLSPSFFCFLRVDTFCLLPSYNIQTSSVLHSNADWLVTDEHHRVSKISNSTNRCLTDIKIFDGLGTDLQFFVFYCIRIHESPRSKYGMCLEGTIDTDTTV